MKLEKLLMPLGMVATAFYLIHTTLGRILWSAYNPLTTDISSLTAEGAPNAALLRVFTTIYGICFILFVIGLLMKAFRQYHSILRMGFAILLVMVVTSTIGYGLFPITDDKTTMSFQNIMHIIVTAVVVLTTVLSGFVIAAGYLKQEHMKKIGIFTLVMAILITIFGMLTPIVMGMQLNILGLTERLTIYSLLTMVSVLSYYESRIGSTEKKAEKI